MIHIFNADDKIIETRDAYVAASSYYNLARSLSSRRDDKGFLRVKDLFPVKELLEFAGHGISL